MRHQIGKLIRKRLSQRQVSESSAWGEIQLTDAMSKLDSIYGVTFEGKTYDIGNRLEWLKTSNEFALDDEEFKDDLISYMKSYI